MLIDAIATELPVANKLVLATRGSTLALAQARKVRDALSTVCQHLECHIMPVATRGDYSYSLTANEKETLVDMAKVTPGLFTAQVTAEVLQGTASAAVHSLKDLPLKVAEGLCLAAILPRASVEDILIVRPQWREPTAPLGLRAGVVIGTSAPRRVELLKHFAPQAKSASLRGNITTRLQRCRDGMVGGLLLAKAGLQRINVDLQEFCVIKLPADQWVPAPGQGAIAVEARRDSVTAQLLSAIDDGQGRRAVSLERAVLQALGGGCGAACGAYAHMESSGFWTINYGFMTGASDEHVKPGLWGDYRLQDTFDQCLRLISAWGNGKSPPGSRQPWQELRWSLETEI